MSIAGGMGGIYPPQYFRWGGWPVQSSPPIFHGGISYYTNNICEVPTKMTQEIAGFECGNAKISLARSARSRIIDYLNVYGLPAVLEACIVSCH